MSTVHTTTSSVRKKGIKTMQNQMLNEYILEGEGVTVSVDFMFL